MQSRSDIDLFGSIASGNRDAFNIFVNRHVSGLVSYITRMTGNKAQAEDIAQETFIRVWQKAATWKDQGNNPLSWLYRIAHNLSIDAIRKQSNKIELPGQETSESGPEDISIEHEQIQAMTMIMDELPQRQKEVLALHTYSNLGNSEIADLMHVSVDAVESLLARARRTMRKQCLQRGLMK